ncbi:MFS transporter [Actinoallomurus sp. NPDC050550]|uniref:MFS transporter n=1 Tax=Actinoallomurus sp. NPDC050550 TaxID=3154937 RepID=UPI0033FC931D
MSANATNAPPVEGGPTAGRAEWTGLLVLALATLVLSLDLSVLSLALPHLAEDLGASGIQQLWIMDIYGFMTAGFLITMGTVGDRVGRRRLLMIGTAVFAVASVAAAYSQSPEALIAARAVMGLAAATVMPSGMALIATMFVNPVQRGMAISSWMSCFMIGMLLGPVVGGIMLHFFWWGSVFLIGVPVVLVLLVVAPRVLPESRSDQAGRIDPLSVVLSLGAVLGVAYGFKRLAVDGWEALPIGIVVAGLLLGALFVYRQHRMDVPLLDLSLFGIPAFAVSLVLGLLGGAVQGGSAFMVNLHLQMVEGLSPLKTGLWLLPTFLAMILGLMMGPGIAQKVKPGYVISAGLPIAAVGYVLLTQVGAHGGLALVLIGFAVTLFGVGIPMGLGTGLGMSTAPPQKVGAASSLMQTCNELGVAVGIALLGSIGTAVYRSDLGGKLPDGLPKQAHDGAMQSIAGAVNVAKSIPGKVGDDVLRASREAFTSGLHTVAIVAAVVMVCLAVVTGTVLRHMLPTPPGMPGGPPGGPGGPGEQHATTAGEPSSGAGAEEPPGE